MGWRKSWIIVMIFGLAGCSSILTSEKPAPVYYQIEYEAAPVDCEHSFNQQVWVWEFSAASPFNRAEMVVVQPGGEVRFSDAYQWVASPGVMLAEHLARDLSTGELFPLVVTGTRPGIIPLELSGRVYRWAWEEEGEVSRAVLKIELSLIETGAEREVVFHRMYNLRSQAFDKDNSVLFAQAMGDLVGRLSGNIRRDLCRVAAERSAE